MKQIIFVVVDNGVDGRGSNHVVFATTNENERDSWFNNHPNKCYFRCVDEIHDLQNVALAAWTKLNAVEKLSFLSTNAPMWKESFSEKTVGKKGIIELT